MGGEGTRAVGERVFEPDEACPVGVEIRLARGEARAVRLGGVGGLPGLASAGVALGAQAGEVVGGEGEVERAQARAQPGVRARLAGLPLQAPDLLVDLVHDVV